MNRLEFILPEGIYFLGNCRKSCVAVGLLHGSTHRGWLQAAREQCMCRTGCAFWPQSFGVVYVQALGARCRTGAASTAMTAASTMTVVTMAVSQSPLQHSSSNPWPVVMSDRRCCLHLLVPLS